MSKVYINIVIYNSEKFLPDLFRSIEEQIFCDYTVIVIDNASTDKGAIFVRENYLRATVLRNHKNIGFAAAHNQGIELALKMNGPAEEAYILVTNPDIILEPNFLLEITAVADRYPEYGSFSGKVLRLNSVPESGLGEKSRIIDTTGLVMRKSRRVVERGVGENDQGQYNQMMPVFGASGALALYRAGALERVSIRGEYFDSRYFCYKEDVDLAWRMQNLGIQSLYVPKAVAYHWRSIKLSSEQTLSLRFKFPDLLGLRRMRSPFHNQLSYRNHWLSILKNDRWVNILRHFPWIFWEELQKFFFLLIFEPRTWLAGFETIAYWPYVLSWRQAVRKKVLVSAKIIRSKIT